MTEQTTPKPIATFGDWVRLVDGTPATVTYAQPFRDQDSDRGGVSYTLMFKGGHEVGYFHYDGDDHLVLATLAGPNRTQKTVPTFVVVDG
jgi:hypothetical protein